MICETKAGKPYEVVIKLKWQDVDEGQRPGILLTRVTILAGEKHWGKQTAMTRSMLEDSYADGVWMLAHAALRGIEENVEKLDI